MDKHYYYCTLTMGNMSLYETEMFKTALESFLNAFQCKKFTIEKVSVNTDDDYFYEASIEFHHFQYIRVLRFSEALVSLSLFWGFTLHELALE